MSKTKKAGRTPVLRQAVLVALKEKKRATATELGKAVGHKVTSIYLSTLVELGYLRVVEEVKTGKKGRPAHVYGLTAKGSATALNLAKAAKVAQAA